MTLAERIEQLVQKHGSLRALARVMESTPAYLWRLKVGEKTNPGPAVLRKLGLRRVVSYELLRTAKHRTNADAALQNGTRGEERIKPDPSTGAQP